MGKRRIPHKFVDNVEYKWCRTCQSWQLLTLFYKYKSTVDGHAPYCSLCVKKWKKENPEIVKERRKKSYWKNPEKYRKETANWISENRERHREYKQEHYQKNKEYYSAVNKEWNQKNEMNRYYSDIQFRMIKVLRTGLRSAIRRGWKKGKMLDLLGCSIEQLVVHLESQFDENMEWGNYGNYWHIDHIKPCASFDLSDIEQQKVCFHYTNLQPLEAIENIKKSNKLDWKAMI